VPAKRSKQTNDDFCPQCGQTYPRDQRDYHLFGHFSDMNKEILGALENIRHELAQRNMATPQSA
jgi:hypothetical protein